MFPPVATVVLTSPHTCFHLRMRNITEMMEMLVIETSSKGVETSFVSTPPAVYTQLSSILYHLKAFSKPNQRRCDQFHQKKTPWVGDPPCDQSRIPAPKSPVARGNAGNVPRAIIFPGILRHFVHAQLCLFASGVSQVLCVALPMIRRDPRRRKIHPACFNFQLVTRREARIVAAVGSEIGRGTNGFRELSTVTGRHKNDLR